MQKRMPAFFPQRAKLRVDRKAFVANLEGEGIIFVDIGAPNAASANSLLNAQSIAAVGTFAVPATVDQNEKLFTRWGRAVQLVASGASAITVTVRGRDYLNSLMVEDIVLNGATPVTGKKAFRYVDSITTTAASAGVTVNLGVANVFGLPEKFVQLALETKNGIPAANAGTFVPGLPNTTAATANNADVRGTYAPSTVLPDGVTTFELRYYPDGVNLHGNKQFAV